MASEGTLRPGAALGRYRLEQLLGTGGMAAVWRARDERLGRPVAVKVLSDTLALDRDYVRRFEREAKIAAGLSHPNLVTVFDYGTEDGRPYLVSEYVAGGTLADRIDAGDAIDVAALASQLLNALGHIHSAGVIHRDVKPANVLLDPDGHSRLTDFGIAQPGDATSFTGTGKVIGTRGYIAPEVEAGQPASERSDLYSCGMLLADCGAASFPELAMLVDRLTAEDPARRPRSAAQALKLLDAGPEAPTVAIAPPTLAPTEVKPPSATVRSADRRHRRRVAVGALAAAVVAVLLGLALAQSIGDDGGGELSAAPAEKKKPVEKPTPTEPTTTATPRVTVPVTTPVTTPQPSCAMLELQRQTLEEQEKAQVDKAAKKVIKERKKTVDEQLKACDGEEGGDEDGAGIGQGFTPPGQAKKEELGGD